MTSKLKSFFTVFFLYQPPPLPLTNPHTKKFNKVFYLKLWMRLSIYAVLTEPSLLTRTKMDHIQKMFTVYNVAHLKNGISHDS